ncbi:MAG TPA: CpsB/CapC family capsule biosynthesis tyrosine phosphatase [Terriglobales bacterium]|nr:CpsB/CapC family capsule biosynthesis tyrosine phosphatase [Terriglobales bacterium]
MIDIHCHLLPGVDDGAKSWEIAREMCQIAATDGITHIVATPHANERYAYDRVKLKSDLQRLQESAGHQPRLSLGCDFHLSYENLQDALLHPERYTIEGTNYMLVELSDYSIPVQVTDCFRKLGDAGIIPILTHPERNAILKRSPEPVLEWADEGCVIQVTASAFTGRWGETVRRIANWLLNNDAVHVLATDAHDLEHRPPILSGARELIAESHGEAVARALVQDNPQAVVDNVPLPYFPRRKQKSVSRFRVAKFHD